jgi:hypothetical protein
MPTNIILKLDIVIYFFQVLFRFCFKPHIATYQILGILSL